jgi:NAD(P)-dependent dehydrogenase (short-subunit alcohol dehydrogenase family)
VRLPDKVAIVTGAGSGIGRAIAKAFAREGAKVVVADLVEGAAAGVVAEIEDAGGVAVACRADVAEEHDNADMVALAVDRYGRVDILHNNAAMTDPALAARDMDFLNFDTEVWQRSMAVNVLGPVFASKHALPHMIAQGKGSIIMTSSVSSLRGDIGGFSYGVSKAALNWYAKTIAVTFGKQGVRCNAILPGVTRTPSQARYSTEETLVRLEKLHLTPYLGEPEDIAAMALFLASDEARFVTGQCISVDGGFMASLPHVPMIREMLTAPAKSPS